MTERMMERIAAAMCAALCALTAVGFAINVWILWICVDRGHAALAAVLGAVIPFLGAIVVGMVSSLAEDVHRAP